MKTFRIFIILFIILATLLVSNYFIDYYEISNTNKYIISENTTLGVYGSIFTRDDADKIFEKTEVLTIPSDEVETSITNNDTLNFFESTDTINIDYSNVEESFEIDLPEKAILNLDKMKSLKTVNFVVGLDDFSLKKEFGYKYTTEQAQEYTDNFKKEMDEKNSQLVKSLEDLGFEVNIEIELV